MYQQEYYDSEIARAHYTPIPFYSKKHLLAKDNYEIYDKELIAIVRSKEKLRLELESIPPESRIQILSNH